MKLRNLLAAGVAIASAGFGFNAHAGPYSDELAKCLVKSTTTEDKGTLVKWIFTIAALHPELSGVSAVNTEQRMQLNKRMAGLLESLLTESCKAQLQEAVRYEGTSTIEASFGVLGEAAMMELFSNKAVSDGLGDFAKYLDGKKFEAVLKQDGG